MIDDLKERLLDENVTGFNLTIAAVEAAERIEQLERENQRLRRALADTEALEIGTGERCTTLLADNARLREALENMCRSVLNESGAWAQFNALYKDAEEALAATPEQSLDALLDPYKVYIEWLRKALTKISNRFDYGPKYGSVEWAALNDAVNALTATPEQIAEWGRNQEAS